MRILRPLGLFCVIFSLGWIHPLQADIGEARNVVVNAIENIYGDIKADYSTEDALRASIDQSLEYNFIPALDLGKFTKLILASHWKKATPAQRQQITEILQAFLIRTLAKAIVEHRDMLASYKDHITVMDAVPGRNEDRALVSVVVQNQSTGSVDIDFRMGREENQWRAYDVVVKDVSFAINYRAILNSEIRQHGIDKVVESFNAILKGQAQ